MPITIFIEIAIGVVLVWFMMAMAAMAVQEWVANLLRWRARDLERVIREMLVNKDIADQFYNHPLLKSLSMRPMSLRALWYKITGKKASGTRPSYIPDHTFALALLDVISTAGNDDSVIDEMLKRWTNYYRDSLESLETVGELPRDVEKALQKAQTMIKSVIAGSDGYAQITPQVQAITEAIKQEIRKALSDQPEVLELLETLGGPILDGLPRYMGSAEVISSLARLGMKNPTLSKTLNSLMDGALNAADKTENVIAAYRTNVETWFNDVMARLGGVYKRRAQWISFLLGLVLAIAFNVDSLTVVNELYREPTLRASLVARAELMDELPQADEQTKLKDSLDSLQTELDNLGLPIGWSYQERLAPCDETPVGTQDDTQAIEPELVIPWGEKVVTSKGITTTSYRCLVAAGPAKGFAASQLLLWTSKILGWLVTGAMAAQGAPFWFDILKKLVNVRSSGSNPTEEKEKK